MKVFINRAIMFCFTAALGAQNTDPPTFSTGTRLIEISVLATDRGGPVLDLTKGDFRIRDNKRDAIISVFIPPSAARPSSSIPQELKSGSLRASTSVPGSAAIVLDWLNMGFAEKAYARQKTIDMLKAIGLTDRVALFANFRTMRFLYGFTDNNSALLESLSTLRPDVDSPAENAIFGTRDMDAFAAIDNAIRIDATKHNILPVIELLRRQPGRKSLIWVSTSFNLPTVDLIRSNITLYTVDARGVQTKSGLSSGAQAQEAFQARLDDGQRNAMRYAAESTGGTYFGGRNDLDVAMHEALAETQTSYTLGYYLPENAEPGEHKIQIDVNRRAVQLRHRKSYTVELPSSH